MTVNELNRLTRKLIQQGYGCKKVTIKEDGIFIEGVDSDRGEE